MDFLFLPVILYEKYVGNVFSGNFLIDFAIAILEVIWLIFLVFISMVLTGGL